MTAEFILHFDTVDDFLRLLDLLKESGIKDFAFKPKIRQKKTGGQPKRKWNFGIGDLGGKLDRTNIRDYAYKA